MYRHTNTHTNLYAISKKEDDGGPESVVQNFCFKV